MSLGAIRTEKERNQAMQLGKGLVGQLFMVLRTIRIHDANNQTVLVATENFKDALNTIWSVLGQVKLEFIEDQAYLNDVRVRMDAQGTENVRELGNDFRARGLGGLTFKRPVTTEGIRSLIQVFSQVQPGAKDAAQQMHARLVELRDLAVEILGPRSFQDRPPEEEISVDPRLWALQTYAKAVLAVKRFVAEAGDEQALEGVDPRLKLTRVVQDLVDIADERANLLLKICAIKDCTDYVYNHAVNVGLLSISLGKAVGLSRTTLMELGMAGLFADLGFTQGLVDTLEKSQLDEREKDELSRHTLHAVKLLIGKGALNRASMRRVITAFQHHVHHDLRGGYPEQARHIPLHLFARVVCIADNYDALTTNRPWREAFAPAEALQVMMAEAGRKFDPVLLRLLVNLLGILPLGTRVRLSTGEVGTVYHAPADPQWFDRPYVKVSHDAGGKPVDRTLIRDLTEKGPDGQFRCSILKNLDDTPLAA